MEAGYCPAFSCPDGNRLMGKTTVVFKNYSSLLWVSRIITTRIESWFLLLISY
jgi:hypothetical protein